MSHGASPGQDGPCEVHEEVRAGFQCTSCGALLCDHCIDVGKYLVLCGLCGERVVPLPGTPDPLAEPAEPPVFKKIATGDASETVSSLIHLTNHVVIPAATIAMVASLLFFLVDLRSIFLPYAFSLKWLGFCYVTATVLIARYGRMSVDGERLGCYTGMLAAAMTLVLLLAPWERSASFVSRLLNIAIVLAVWHYASRLTASLSREGEDEQAESKLRLYGQQRLELEAWQEEDDGARLQKRRRERKAAKAAAKQGDAHGNPSAAVGRLAAGALLVFAVGEPLILAGPPQVGERALAAMVVFLFSSGLVLAAGSAIGTLRHARRLEGEVSEGLIPARLMSGGCLMVVILAVALAVPGIAYRGSGALEPVAREGVQSEQGTGDSDQDTNTEGESSKAPQRRHAGEQESLGPASEILNLLTTLGRFLVLPFVIAVFLGALFVLSRLAPHLAEMRLSGWRGFLARLAARLARQRSKKKERRRSGLSADLNLDGLHEMAPREAVVTGYARLLLALAAIGYARERRTPGEVLAELPAHLRELRRPLELLTPIYVRAAYSTEELEEQEKQDGVRALVEIKRLLPKS